MLSPASVASGILTSDLKKVNCKCAGVSSPAESLKAIHKRSLIESENNALRPYKTHTEAASMENDDVESLKETIAEGIVFQGDNVQGSIRPTAYQEFGEFDQKESPSMRIKREETIEPVAPTEILNYDVMVDHMHAKYLNDKDDTKPNNEDQHLTRCQLDQLRQSLYPLTESVQPEQFGDEAKSSVENAMANNQSAPSVAEETKEQKNE